MNQLHSLICFGKDWMFLGRKSGNCSIGGAAAASLGDLIAGGAAHYSGKNESQNFVDRKNNNHKQYGSDDGGYCGMRSGHMLIEVLRLIGDEGFSTALPPFHIVVVNVAAEEDSH
jgi:hypothetical protein